MDLLRHFLVAALLCWYAPGGASPVVTENVEARLVAERLRAVPGETIALALIFDIRPDWHTYWNNPGDSGEAPRIRWRLPEGVAAGPIRWPSPELIRVGPLSNYGYSNRALHLIDLAISPDWETGRPIELVAEASWLVCSEHCIPEQATLTLRIPTGAKAGAADPEVAGIFASARRGLPRQLPGDAHLRRTGAGLALEVDSTDLPQALDRAWFFAAEWGLVEHAAEQPLEMSGRRLTLNLTPGPLAADAAADGVLVIEAAGVEVAYAVQADPLGVPSRDGSRERRVSDLGLPLALGFALMGGIILNLMPCVFPVLAIKALSLTAATGRRHRISQGVAYSAGVLSFFALVAVALLAMRSGGAAVGWGVQLQSPSFVVLMAYLFFVLGLSLTGAVTLGAGLMGLGSAGPSGGAAGAFATGALAALVAAPCTAPFMGAALGYALTLSWPRALAVMLMLGFGFSLPYLLLSLVPYSGKLLPKPGRWMENIRQFLAFPMFGTAAWLVWVLAVQRGADAVAAALAGILFLALGLWVWERLRQSTDRMRLLGGCIGASLLGLALFVGLLPGRSDSRPGTAGDSVVRTGGPAAQAFSPERLAAARAQERPVFVNMTAAWCITCLVNERVALSSTRLAEAFDAADVLYLKGDWTSRDPVISRYLEGFGRSGVPIYVFYPVAGSPRVLPQILTESMVANALTAKDSTE